MYIFLKTFFFIFVVKNNQELFEDVEITYFCLCNLLRYPFVYIFII